MIIGNIIVTLIILTIIALAVFKIQKDKKKGIPCTGCSSCPFSGSCDSNSSKQ